MVEAAAAVQTLADVDHETVGPAAPAEARTVSTVTP